MRCLSITVGARAVDTVVAFAADEHLRTSALPDLPARAMTLLPGLRGHRCDNGAGLTFAQELADTEVAHLFEHVAVELMALAGSPDTLAGRTTWDFRRDGRGVFHVLVDYDDDLIAIGALTEAVPIVRWLCAPNEDVVETLPDVRAAVARLRKLRRRRSSLDAPTA